MDIMSGGFVISINAEDDFATSDNCDISSFIMFADITCFQHCRYVRIDAVREAARLSLLDIIVPALIILYLSTRICLPW